LTMQVFPGSSMHYHETQGRPRFRLNTGAPTLTSNDRNALSAVAIRKGQNRMKAAGLITMGTVRCDGCGEEFLIGHHPALANAKNAERQAKWLDKVLAYDHECDRKHGDRIDLPD